MKTVLITGATKNTGLAIAHHFAKNGYAVAITGRNSESAKNIAKTISNEYKTTAKGYALELSNTRMIKKVFSQIEKDFGRLDVFVANAANLGVDFALLNTNESDFYAITDVNIKGTFFCCQAAAEIMKR